MELWVILLIGAVVFTWCAIYGFLHVGYLLNQSPPKASGITLIMLFIGWGFVTAIVVTYSREIEHWMFASAVYIGSFMTTFANVKSWWKAINNFLPYD